jgi:pyridoxal phosphate enzyme (YggS family)
MTLAQYPDPELEVRYQTILKRIGAAAAVSSFSQKVTLLAVSKTQSVDAIEQLYRLGHRDFGENYAQELVEKAVELQRRHCTEIRWHFIGHLQTNKVKAIIPWVCAVHTLDTLKLALELAKRGGPQKLAVFIEVNIDQEASKSGVLPAWVPSFIREVGELSALDILGLMCIPAPSVSSETTRSAFMQLRELEKVCKPQSRGMLSMGMSGDFELAIQEGATHVRVGTALFGERKPSL